jgi:spermidine synthase
MKPACCLLGLALALCSSTAAERGNYVESFDTIYNSLTIEKNGTMVEMRARSRRGEALESAVDLADPLKLVVGYTRTLYAGLFFQPKPSRVMMIGLGGAGFHRLFNAAYPDTLLQSVELDPKVLELCETRLAFKPTAQTPVALMDGRMFVKRDKTKWDWIILDAFRGGYVPSHLKTEEFYRECAARLDDRGVFISNLHSGTELFYSDLKTIRSVFPQVAIFETAGRGNVIACAVKYRSPDMTKPENWAQVSESVAKVLAGRLDLVALKAEQLPMPEREMRLGRQLTDDFSPVEFLDAMKTNNTAPR